jgi:DNA polymerase
MRPFFGHLTAGAIHMAIIQGIGLDWETRSYSDIKTDPLYVTHPTTEPILLAWSFRGISDVWDILAEKKNAPSRLIEALSDPGVDVLSFSSFDHRVYDQTYSSLELPFVEFDRWVDVQSTALACGLARRLDTVGEQLGLGHKQADGKDLIKQFCSPRIATKKREAGFNQPDSDPNAWDRFKRYALRDVDLMMQIVQAIGYLNPTETAVAAATRRMNSRGIPFDHNLVRLIDERFKCLQANVAASLLEMTGGIPGNSANRFRHWFNNRFGTALSTMSDAAELLAKGGLPEEAVTVLSAREIVASKAGGKAAVILSAGIPDQDGVVRVRDSFVYCGASATGRFAGRGVQPQNFPRPTHKQAAIDKYLREILPAIVDTPPESIKTALAEISQISSSMRALVSHPRGIAWVDYSGIEIRTLAVTADAFMAAAGGEELEGATSISSKLAAGVDLYIEMGVKIAKALGVDGVTDENCEALGWRQLGKAAVLGLGYHQGAKKFMTTTRIDGRDMTFNEADAIVKAYRSAYPAVTALWRWLPSSLIRCVETGRSIGLSGVFRYEMVDGQTVRMVKPSGSSIWYRGIQISKERDRYGRVRKTISLETTTAGGAIVRSHIHGGTLLEHVCSSLARDLLVHSMVKAEAAGIEIVSCVHDELVAIGGEDVALRLEKIMLDLPEWAAAWPIGASKSWGASWGK